MSRKKKRQQPWRKPTKKSRQEVLRTKGCQVVEYEGKTFLTSGNVSEDSLKWAADYFARRDRKRERGIIRAWWDRWLGRRSSD